MKICDWMLFVYCLMNLLACQTPQTQPKVQAPLTSMWAGKIYVGDSLRLGVAQSKLSPVVGCSDPQFDRMICMGVEDYTALMQYFIQAACVNQ